MLPSEHLLTFQPAPEFASLSGLRKDCPQKLEHWQKQTFRKDRLECPPYIFGLLLKYNNEIDKVHLQLHGI